MVNGLAQSQIEKDFFQFISPVLEKHFIDLVAAAIVDLPSEYKLRKENQAAIEKILEQAAFDAAYTLSFLTLPKPGSRILEVGSGTGLLGAFLNSLGYDIYLSEPARIGFETHAQVFKCVTRFLGVPQEKILTCQIEDLESGFDIKYDLIFSNNVMEHVDDPQRCLKCLNNILAFDGVMIHNCPNYLVPYEPHYGIPLIPFAPRVTELFVSNAIAKDGVWKSLNFITAINVMRSSKKLGALVIFRRGLLCEALTRLYDDPAYARRHPTVFRWAKILTKLRLLKLLTLLPPIIATPMIFVWKRSK